MKTEYKPLVSVAVVTYNSSATIIETLDSIATQTYQNLELIVSDDCSTDNTIELVRAWISEHKERFVRSELLTVTKNTGVSANYNRAASACKGEWVKDLDGDDLLLPNCVQTYVDFITNNTEIVYVFAKGKCFGTDEKYVEQLSKHFATDFFDWDKKKQLDYLYLCGSPIFSSSAFYNRKSCINLGFKNDERIPNYEDRPKWIRIIENDIPHAYIPKETICYRISGSSISTTVGGSKVFSQSMALFDKYYRIPYIERNGYRWYAFRHKLVNRKRISQNLIWKIICKGMDLMFGKEPDWTKGFSIHFTYWLDEKKNIVFLPCRKGSQRIPQKNTRPFAGNEGGLLRIKLEELLKSTMIDEIILSSNDEEVLKIGESMHSEKIRVMRRPEDLCSSSTSTDDLINYVSGLIDEGTVIWTHVTSPFLKAETYDKMISLYYEHQKEYDSLMSVNKIQTFLWNKENSVNYNREVEKWPRTQTLEPLYEVNSGVFIADAEVYHQLHDRIGRHVQLFETSQLESIDIDWPEDFDFAEQLYRIKQ